MRKTSATLIPAIIALLFIPVLAEAQVTSVSVTTANGVSGSVANPTTTPAISLTLGAITPSSVASTGAVSGTTISPTGSSAPTNGLYLPSTNILGLSANSALQAEITPTASAVNYLTFTGGATGAAPTIANAGSDSSGAGLGLTITAKTVTGGASGTGGTLTLEAGSADPVNAGNGTGGAVNISSGNGSNTNATGAPGGAVNITTGVGAAQSAGGAFNVATGDAGGNYYLSGAINLTTGSGSLVNNIGTGNITLKTSPTENANSGSIILTVGSATGGTAGNIQLLGSNVGIGNTSPSALLDIGNSGSTLGTLRLEGNTSGYVQLQPAAAAGSWTMTLPSNAGTSGYVLQTDGSGGTSWVTHVGSGTVTSVSVVTANGVSGTVASATTTPAITLALGAITPSSVTSATISPTGSSPSTNGMYLPATNTVGFSANGALQTEILPTTSAVNYLTLTGGTSGNSPVISVAGTDSDIVGQSVGVSVTTPFNTQDAGISGEISLITGDGYNGGVNGKGGAINLLTGAGGSGSGDVNIASGTALSGNDSGNVNISSGPSAYQAGNINLTTGYADYYGGNIVLTVGTGTTANGNIEFLGGNVGIGTSGPIASLDLSHETDALALPVGTTGQRPTGGALTAGEIRYNTTTTALEGYVNGAWASIVTGSAGLPSLSSADIWVGNGSNVATAVALSGDCTLANTGAITCTKSNGTTLGALATLGVGTGLTSSGGNLNLSTPVAVGNGGTGSSTTFTQGSIVFAGPSGVYAQDNAQFFWDDVDFRLSIGTASPSKDLSFGGAAARTVWVERGASTGYNLTLQAGGGVAAGTNENGGNLVLASGITTGTGTSNIQFSLYPAGSSGTSDNTALTAATLSATGTTGSNAVTMLQANAGSGTNKNGGTLTLASGISTGTGTSGINFNVYGAGSSGSSPNSSTTAMTIAGAGYVGIGTTAPAAALDVENTSAGSNQISSYLSPSLGNNNYNLISFGKATSLNQAGTLSYTYNSGTLANSFVSIGLWGSSFLLNVNGLGNVGIGTTSPSYTLHVNGSVAGTSAYINLSDVRHKKNIEPLSIGLEVVTQLKPVSFEWKEKPKDIGMEGRQIGFIAQDVEKILPSVVVTQSNDEGTKGMKYSEITPVLVKAIQEIKVLFDTNHDTVGKLQDTVSALKDTVSEQQNEIDALKQSIAKLSHP